MVDLNQIIFLLFFSVPLMALGQGKGTNEAERKKIWETIKTLNRAWINKRTDEFKNCFHPQMISIQPEIAERLVGGESCIESWTDFSMKTEVISFEEKDPLIQIYGDTAVVTYYYNLQFEFQGKIKTVLGRDMTTLVKENGKWLIVADHFSPFPKNADRPADIKAIEKLRETDLKASKIGDTDTLLSLMSDDIVLIYPDREPLKGIGEMRKSMEAYRKELENIEIIQYSIVFEELLFAGDYAFEWGSYHHKYKIKNTKDELEEKGKLMRILRREADGYWKVIRSIWNKK